eukprot:2306824-Pleurochrysis_carterae.AAC.3
MNDVTTCALPNVRLDSWHHAASSKVGVLAGVLATSTPLNIGSKTSPRLSSVMYPILYLGSLLTIPYLDRDSDRCDATSEGDDAISDESSVIYSCRSPGKIVSDLAGWRAPRTRWLHDGAAEQTRRWEETALLAAMPATEFGEANFKA